MSSLRPPSGGSPPAAEASYREATLELRPLAQEICRRYRLEFEDEHDRYGDAGIAWCVHDNQYLLQWACSSVSIGPAVLNDQVAWLGRVLGARAFPLERLVRNLELAADVVEERVEDGAELAAALRDARGSVVV